jgi:hypothetical protein
MRRSKKRIGEARIGSVGKYLLVWNGVLLRGARASFRFLRSGSSSLASCRREFVRFEAAQASLRRALPTPEERELTAISLAI